ncbi:gluconate 2-dehydrogenase subunit 3 family protein [Gramella lutea]|uniref:Gluconate 2-dehydrogenase subunit 3 family protein n=1 Tax=Christiangramia lutea TaxID=1607951 RepID=A0A9X1V547_9FLAO|nr:gluconate 2-dehydrogenase subunit 3 family protein [Christiangramia lutea]MCH4824374.1 gluconate 2-dehydrogenase subunit 3 family protein [Christiangramia lutea]
MDRRESLKTLLIGGAGSSLLLSCRLDDTTDVSQITDIKEREFDYGRTPEEAAHDEKLMDDKFYTEAEIATIAVLADIIIPGDGEYPPASETGVTDFIEFITKDIPEHKTPMRGGLKWLSHETYKRYEKEFIDCSKEEQIEIVEDIAYPEEVKPELSQGANFFSRIRNLVTTGYFTSKEGIEYLGYMGNRPNVWDGVPEDVLKKHGMEYDEKTLKRSIKPEERNDIADWSNYEV